MSALRALFLTSRGNATGDPATVVRARVEYGKALNAYSYMLRLSADVDDVRLSGA